ncbi:MAG: Tim44/TimA family putative adaptor protein, partial [Alphaproteobacteria bacterium]|nr:Tim44/TimA family putative adaptor protein [Alphaproteobacteria bacterium]
MDILFFAALAFFVFYKLSKQFGKIDEEEKRQIEEKLAQMRVVQEQQIKQREKIIGASSTDEKTENKTENKAEEKILAELDEATRQNLIPILQHCNVTAEFFLNGAKSAFEMVLKAFSAADLPTLKFLLAENIFAGFETAINQRKAEEKTITTNLIAFVETKIISAMLLENTASIAIRFVSKQINYISDKEGEILTGRKDEIAEVTDVWTFKRDVT